ncbi:aspartyl/asparaginyl beta-hydroxylase domain-containing protein [Sphingomonas hylomeconis]|uniref:Aspartyl/asparaginyl beta-hydroxylase domain-containing protein n=1 Tax=Sphingomonas hylomeconis TaxID=1395958 RepID=A0ABV7SSN5_9SPHN|nr:aspartyl/asparaginyl beta-hydroxylase domain-containing protein [Sphingomonas hylomeconis]
MDARERDADALAARGDVAGALALLERVVTATPEHAEAWMKVAALRRAQGKLEEAQDAIGVVLRIDPLHFMALISRARLFEMQGNSADAARFYNRALAQLPDGAVPAHLTAMIDHARRVGTAYQDAIAARWAGIAAAQDDLDDTMRRRVARLASNALHRTRVYHSEPTHYHYPGLAEREFHDRDAFPWLAALEAQTDTIRDEYLALQQRQGARAEPYVQYDPGLPVRQWAALNHSLDWTAFHLLQNGAAIGSNAATCPRTIAALGPIGQPSIAGRSPNAMFSLLKPHTRIPPHTGVANTRLVCHLPLIVPDGCWFRVGAETRAWRIGEAFVFDDTIEHEAANDSDAPRVVLIFDVWHPGLAPAERTAVARLMEADDSDGAPL